MLILFSGYDRSGKDSAFEAIQERIIDFTDSNVHEVGTRIAHADHLKEVCFKVFGVTESMKGTGAEDYYRMCLTRTSEIMKIATDNDMYFTDYLIDTIGLRSLCSPDKLYVCTDGRYDYEIMRFKDTMSEYCATHDMASAFFPIKVTRPDCPPTPYALENHNFPEYRKFAAEIINSGTVEEYKIKIRNLLSTLILNNTKDEISDCPF